MPTKETSSQTTMYNMDYTCTCGATTSSRASITQYYKICNALVITDMSGSSSISSSSASPARSRDTAPPQPTARLCRSLKSPLHSCTTSSPYRWRNSRPYIRQISCPQPVITPGFHLYYRCHMESLLTDAMTCNAQVQQRMKEHEATIKELQQRLEELKGIDKPYSDINQDSS